METRTDKTPAQIENDAIEGNEIIAAWLGWIRREPGEYNLPNWWEPDRNDLRLKGKFRGYPHQLRFHSSWDWLMPVVEKIQQTGPRSTSFLSGLAAPREHVFTIHESYTGEHKLIQRANDSAIKAVYGAVVEFIKWYTSNQPQKAS